MINVTVLKGGSSVFSCLSYIFQVKISLLINRGVLKRRSST
ncbi:hypothetical protein KCTC52924_01928 [Arenibacter antarcticus]